MDHRSGANESLNGPSVSPNSMPNVLFREIHKNAFLKRHSSDRRTGFPRKSERVWVVFCVHDDVEPFLEIYPDQKVALTHKPEWFASLSSALHVSPTICGHEDEFEFAVTLSFQVVRLAAPSWESMMEWVETIRNKLRELKVLCPKENVYSKMPEPKQQLLPTRDPNSPLPLPPEGPSTLLPGVELVHLQSRNSSSSSDNGENAGRHQRESGHNKNNERQLNKRQKDKRQGVPNSSDLPGTSSAANDIAQEYNEPEIGVIPSNPNVALLKSKSKTCNSRAVSVPQPSTSTSQITTGSNVTVIEVSTTNSSNHHSASDIDFNSTQPETMCDSEDSDDVFHAPQTMKTDYKNQETNSSEEETHYEHVFLLNIPVTKQQVAPSSRNAHGKCFEAVKKGKPHSTSVLINSNVSVPASSSLIESVPGPSGLNSTVTVADVPVGGTTCVKVAEKGGDNSVVPVQVQAKFEKINISGNAVAKVPSRSITKPEAVKSPPPSETKSCSIENSCHQHSVIAEEEEEESSKLGNDTPIYSQVKKIPKVKVKSDELKIPVKNGSPVMFRRNVSDGLGGDIRPENAGDVGKPSRSQVHGKPLVKIAPSSQRVVTNKSSGPVNVTVVKEVTRNLFGHPSTSPSSSGEVEIVTALPSTSSNHPTDNSKISAAKKEMSNGISKPDIEPIAATIPPAVGVITVEDIPLIGGHQRRRRRSSSSDPVPPPPVPTSRVIGGADRIRINVPQSNNMGRDDHRGDSEIGANSRSSISDQIVQINVTPQSSRLTLREQQVLQLRKEMLHPGGVRLQLRRKDCLGSIALIDAFNGVWVAGWKQKEHPLLYNALHIGDQLVSVSDMVVRTAADAQKLIRTSSSFHIEFIIRRVPFGNVFALQRTAEGQPLGIVQEGNTAEIKEILPNSLAAKQGLTSKTPSSDGLSLTTWFITEINGRPLNLFFKDSEVRDRLNAVGKEISILVQPHDFIKQMKKQLKNLRSYKDYIVQ